MNKTRVDAENTNQLALLNNDYSIVDSPPKQFSNETIHKLFNKIEHFFKQIQLVFKSIGPDFKSLKAWQILILILYAVFNFTFSILDFNSIFFPKTSGSLFKWLNDVKAGLPLWRRILLCLSGISAFTTVLNVVLVIHGKISSYFWGIIGAIFYGSYAFAYGYVGDAQLFIFFYLPMQFVGILIWSKALDKKATTRVRALKFYGWLIVLFLSGILSLLFYYEIPYFSKLLTTKYVFDGYFFAHLLDAITNGMSVVGQCLLVFCYWEQYIIWTIVNILLIVMYSGLLETPLDINLLVVWIMLTVNSSIGLRTWFKRWKNRKSSESINC